MHAFSFIWSILLIQIVDSRKCIDPFSYLECCPNIYNSSLINDLREKCDDYHLTHSPPYETSRKCKKLFCNYECFIKHAHLVSMIYLDYLYYTEKKTLWLVILGLHKCIYKYAYLLNICQ